MIHKITLKFSQKMAEDGIIQSEKTSIYAYGLELMFSSAVGIIALFLVSVILGAPWLWIPYLAGFIPTRLTAGGYHAKTHYGCVVSFTLAYATAFFLLTVVGAFEVLTIILSIFALVTVIILAPVEARSKPIKDILRKRNRKNSILIGILNLILSVTILPMLKANGVQTA